MKRKAFALIFSLIIIVVSVVLSISLLARSISESRIAEKHLQQTRAFWAAEAGVNRALWELRNNYSQCGANIWSSSLSFVDGSYSVDVVCVGQDRNVTVTGGVPALSPQTQRIIEVTIRKEIPANFYDNALYSGGDIDINGNAASVDGDVYYAGTLDNPDNITGNVTNDPSVSPLALLDFEELLTISQSQGNFYDATRLDSGDAFPPTFWYLPPTDPDDPTTGVPNVVYITEDLELNGNIGTIGGFFVVVGDVITSPDDTQDATINGIGQIDGIIYTRGTFRINGGGDGLNINGGVWAGEEIRLNGNAHITFNQDYMTAIAGLDINPEAQVVSWKEQINPYSLTP